MKIHLKTEFRLLLCQTYHSNIVSFSSALSVKASTVSSLIRFHLSQPTQGPYQPCKWTRNVSINTCQIQIIVILKKSKDRIGQHSCKVDCNPWCHLIMEILRQVCGFIKHLKQRLCLYSCHVIMYSTQLQDLSFDGIFKRAGFHLFPSFRRILFRFTCSIKLGFCLKASFPLIVCTI